MRSRFLSFFVVQILGLTASSVSYAIDMTCWDGSLRESHTVCPPVPVEISGTYLNHCDYERELLRYFSKEESLKGSSKRKQGLMTSPVLTETIIIPPKYEWVEGEIPGVSKQYLSIPATFKNISETLIILPKCYETNIDAEGKTKTIVIPEETKDVVKQIIVSPSRIEERDVPHLIRNGKTRLVVEPSRLYERVITY